jgi:hypothetical protein
LRLELENDSIICATPQGREVSLKCAIQIDICCGLMLFLTGIEADASIQYQAIQAHADFIHNLDNYHQHPFNSALAASLHLALDTETREKMLNQSDIKSITTQNSWESHSASSRNSDSTLAHNEQNRISNIEYNKFRPQNVLNVISNATLSTRAVEVANHLVSAGLIDPANSTQIKNFFSKCVRKLVIEHSEIDKFVDEVRAEFAKAPEKVGKNSTVAIGIASKNEKERFLAFAKQFISEGKVPDCDLFWAKNETSTVVGNASDHGFCSHAVFHLTQDQCGHVCKKLGYSKPSTGAGSGKKVKPQQFSGYTLYKKR